MNRILLLSVAVFLLIAAVTFGPAAWDHYQLFVSVQSQDRAPYRIEVRDEAYFGPFVERRGWHAAEISTAQPSRTWDRVLDTLGLPRTVESLITFYAADSTRIGVVRWMLVPYSSKLPSLQVMSFRKLKGGVLYRDDRGRYIVEELGGGMVEFIERVDGGLAEWLLVNDALYQKMKEKRQNRPNQALEPTAPADTDRADARSAPAGAVAHLGR